MIDPCEAYKFDTNYKKLNLKFSNITNVSRILITDKYFNDCSEESVLNCKIDSNVCQRNVTRYFRIRSLQQKSSGLFNRLFNHYVH